MTDEVKNLEEKEIETKECFCQSKGVKKFVIVSLGTFVGAFAALSLFAALNKPPMMPPMGCPMKNMFMGHHHMMKMHHKDCDCKCHKKMMKKYHFDHKKMEKALDVKKVNKVNNDD